MHMTKADHSHCFRNGHVTQAEPLRLKPKTLAGVIEQEEIYTRLVRWKPGAARHHLCQQVERAHLRIKLTQKKAVDRWKQISNNITAPGSSLA